MVLSVLFAIVTLTMPPPHAKKIEKDLQHIGLIDRYEYPPALVLNQKMKLSQARRFVFYSKGIEKEKWIKQRTTIEDELNVYYLEPPEYLEVPCFGGKKKINRNYIVLIVAPGVESKREETLYDDEP